MSELLVNKLFANVMQIPEGGDYEAQIFKIVQMFNRRKNVHITTKNPLLGMCSYKPFFFINLN
jgi:hypothetical protein